jgi:hypothetical protein
LWYNPDHFPRAWIVHDVELLDDVNPHDPDAVQRCVRRVLFPGSRARDLARSATVETEGRGKLPGWMDRPGSSDALEESEACDIVSYEPQRIVILASLTRPGLVVLNDLYAPGWHAEVDALTGSGPQAATIWRTNRVMRGIALPPGRHRITMTYAPRAFFVGAGVSAVGWLALLLGGGAYAVRRGAQRNREASG